MHYSPPRTGDVEFDDFLVEVWPSIQQTHLEIQETRSCASSSSSSL